MTKGTRRLDNHYWYLRLLVVVAIGSGRSKILVFVASAPPTRERARELNYAFYSIGDVAVPETPK